MKRIVWAMLLFALAGCASTPAQRVVSPRVEQPAYSLFSGQYEVVEIEGMTCLVWATSGGWSGITCDWSTYKGGQ